MCRRRFLRATAAHACYNDHVRGLRCIQARTGETALGDLMVLVVLALRTRAFVVEMIAGVLVARRLSHRTLPNQERASALALRDG